MSHFEGHRDRGGEREGGGNKENKENKKTSPKWFLTAKDYSILQYDTSSCCFYS